MKETELHLESCRIYVNILSIKICIKIENKSFIQGTMHVIPSYNDCSNVVAPPEQK